MRDRDFYLYDDGHSSVKISHEGLRRAYGDNAKLLRSSRLHEVAAFCLAAAGVIVLVFILVDDIARAWA